MLGKCFCLLLLAAMIASFFTGQTGNLANAALDGAARAVELVITLSGMTALWCGVMRVLQEAGAVRLLARLLAPLLRPVFPHAFRNGTGREEITAAVSANLLGMGNAATPLALRAMEKLEAENPQPGVATDDMVTLAVLGAGSLNLVPTTLIVLRRAAGSAAPYRIIAPVWICSALCALTGIVLCRLWAAAGRR